MDRYFFSSETNHVSELQVLFPSLKLRISCTSATFEFQNDFKFRQGITNLGQLTEISNSNQQKQLHMKSFLVIEKQYGQQRVKFPGKRQVFSEQECLQSNLRPSHRESHRSAKLQ